MISPSEAVTITGAHGFVGSHLRRRFPEARAYDRRTHSFHDPASLRELVTDAQVIFHFAGRNSGSAFQASPTELLESHAYSTLGLLNAIRVHSARPPIFVILSTIHVYAPAPNGLITENSPVGPVSLYGTHKYYQELILRQAAAEGLIRPAILRATNIYGPGARPFYNSAIATLAHQIQVREPVRIHQGTVDALFIEDALDCLVRADELASADSEIFNLATGCPRALSEVVEIISGLVRIPARVVRMDKAPATPLISIEKLKSAIGFSPRYSLEAGLAQTLGLARSAG